MLLHIQPRSGYHTFAIDLSFHRYYVSCTVYKSVSTAFYFPFPSCLLLAYPQHHSQFSPLNRTTCLFPFSFVYPFPLCSAPIPTFTHACAQNHSLPTEPIFNSICFKYMLQLSILIGFKIFPFMSFSRNYSSAPPDPCILHVLLLSPTLYWCCHPGTYMHPCSPSADYWYISFVFPVDPVPLPT